MTRTLASLVLAAAAAALASGCSSVCRRAPDLVGRVTHEMIDQALEAAEHVHLEVPARALVIDAVEPWRSSGLAAALAGALERSGHLVPEPTIQTPLPTTAENDPSGGLDQVRLLAARQGCRYAVVAREAFDQREGWNPLRILYVGLVTMFFVPGETLETDATLEAALVDVHSGAVVFRASVRDRERSSFILPARSDDERREHVRTIVARAAQPLAEEIDRGIRRTLVAHRACAIDLAPHAHRPTAARGFFEGRP